MLGASSIGNIGGESHFGRKNGRQNEEQNGNDRDQNKKKMANVVNIGLGMSRNNKGVGMKIWIANGTHVA